MGLANFIPSKGLVIINTRDRGERKYNFSQKKTTQNPSKIPLQFSYPIRKCPKNFVSQHVQVLYVLIICL